MYVKMRYMWRNRIIEVSEVQGDRTSERRDFLVIDPVQALQWIRVEEVRSMQRQGIDLGGVSSIFSCR